MDTPLTDAEFANALDPLLRDLPGPLALAVSGGRDSLALLHLTAIWAKPRGRLLCVLTVDHGLRPESHVEAQTVAQRSAALGLPHQTLLWRRLPAARGNLEAQARDGRYRLMAEWCTAAGRATLLLGHTQDDQAETVLMRLARGSGVDGLSAMAPRTQRLGLTLLRPLLDVPRARLAARLRADGMSWLDDPMNDDPGFTRVRLRQAADILAGAGLTRSRLAATAQHMARARRALDQATDALLAQAVEVAPEGYCRLHCAALHMAPDEIGLRLLARLVMSVGGLGVPPRFARLERLYRALRDDGLGHGRTLGGCRILPMPSGRVLILREAAKLAPPLPLPVGARRLWDGRFQVQLIASEGDGAQPASRPALVGPLGPAGLLKLKKVAPHALRPIPPAVRPTLPSLWQNGQLMAVPHLNFVPADRKQVHFEAVFTGLVA